MELQNLLTQILWKKLEFWYLTHSLPRAVKVPWWKMLAHACRQYIFRSYNKSTFDAVRFDGNPVANAKKKVLIFHWSFSNDIVAVKGSPLIRFPITSTVWQNLMRKRKSLDLSLVVFKRHCGGEKFTFNPFRHNIHSMAKSKSCC